MKKLFLFMSVLFSMAVALNAQVIFTEDFNYATGSLLTANGYAAHSGAGTNSPSVLASSLTYTGYSTGVGGSLKLMNTGEDVNKRFITPDSINSGSIYLACLVKVDSAKAAGDYFLHLASPGMLTSSYYVRVFVKTALNNKLAFGIAKATVTAGVTPKYTDSIYTVGTTYLLVAKYTFVTGTNKDDIVSFWVNPTLTGPEPTPAISYVDTASNATDVTSFGSICFRQGTTANGVYLALDAVKISKSWIGGGSTPVELSAFTAQSNGSSVMLSWSTATEINNQKFIVEKRVNGQWIALGSVAGNGTSTSVHNYSFTDLQGGAAEYRLQQIDFDGTVHYSSIVESQSVVNGFSLDQNYPNPFNPSTVISYQLATAGNVTLKVYDVLGSEVATLVNGHQEAGVQKVTFNANNLSAGIYVYKIQAGSFSATRKLMLVK